MNDDMKIAIHGTKPIEFCGDQEGEIGISSMIPMSEDSPFFPGVAVVGMALGTLAGSSDLADPRKGGNLCYVAALPLDKLDDLIGRLLAARALIPGAAPRCACGVPLDKIDEAAGKCAACSIGI